MFEKITTIDINFDTMTQQTQTLTSGDTGTMISITLPDDTPTKCRLAYQSVNEKGAVVNSVSYVQDVTVTTSTLLDFPAEILGYQGYVELSLVCNRGGKGRSLGTIVTFEIKHEQSDTIAQTVFPKTIVQFDNLLHEAQEKQQTLLNQLDTQAKATSKRIDLKQHEAIDRLIEQSDLHNEVEQATTDIADQVNQILQLANESKVTIDSQTDLSNDVAQAKTSMTDSVQSVKDVATSEIESIQAEYPKVKTVADAETAKIQAELPKTQASLEKANTDINNLQTKINEVATNSPVKPFVAWANSRDMVTDFMTIFPNSNLFNQDNKLKNMYTADLIGITYNENFKNGFRLTGDSNRKGAVQFIDNFINKNGTYTISFDIRSTQSAYVSFTLSFFGKESTFVTSPNNLTKKVTLTQTVTDYVNQDVIKFFNIPSAYLVIENFKVEEGNVATPYLPSKKDNPENSFMKYCATSNINSMNPSDYTQGRYTDEYIDYKLQQITNAVVTTSGGA